MPFTGTWRCWKIPRNIKRSKMKKKYILGPFTETQQSRKEKYKEHSLNTVMDGCVGIDDHYRAKYGQLHSGKGKVFLGEGKVW